MIITWDKAVAKIFDAYACVVDDSELLYMGDDGDDIYLDSEQSGTRLKFVKKDNEKILVSLDGQLQLKDEEGTEYRIGLLVRKPLNKHPITGKITA